MIEGEQTGEEEFRFRISPPRPGARPIVLTVGRAPARFQPKTPVPRRYREWDRETGRMVWRDVYRTPPAPVFWVVAGELREDRDALEYITRHRDFGVALRSALRRANKLAATPRSRK